jgi:hypothetical protein
VALHRGTIGLPLPPAQIGAVVLDDQADVTHGLLYSVAVQKTSGPETSHSGQYDSSRPSVTARSTATLGRVSSSALS